MASNYGLASMNSGQLYGRAAWCLGLRGFAGNCLDPQPRQAWGASLGAVHFIEVRARGSTRNVRGILPQPNSVHLDR